MAIFKDLVVSGGENKDKTSSYHQREKISTIFSPLLAVMTISGVLLITRDESKRLKTVLNNCYCILIQTFALLNAVRYTLAFTMDTGDWRYHIGLLSLLWFNSVISYFGVMCLFCCKYIAEFIATFGKYQDDYGLHFNVKRVKLVTNVITGCLIFESLSANIIVVVSRELDWIRKNSLVGINLWPFHLSSGIPFHIANVLQAFVSTYAVTCCMAMMMFYFVALACIKREFYHVTVRLVHLRQANPAIVAEDLKDIRYQHQSIIKVLSSANPILRNVASGFYSMAVPVICFILYGITSKTLLWEDVFAMVGVIIFNLAGMFAITFKGAAVNSVAHEAVEALHNYDLSVLPNRTINQIALFISRLNGPPIGVSVYEMFVIDYPTVLMIFGTIITYAVVAVQFSSIDTDCNGTTFNNTNVSAIM